MIFFIPIEIGFEKCPSCGRVLRQFNPSIGNSVGTPLLRCEACNKEWVSGQNVEWLFLNSYNKALHICNIIVFSIGLSLLLIGFVWAVAALYEWSFSFKLAVAFGLVGFVAFCACYSMAIFSSMRRTREADYIHRLHRANVFREYRISPIGLIILCSLPVIIIIGYLFAGMS